MRAAWATALLITLAACAPAHALLFRAYLAPSGSDANPCTLAQPCRLLPAALAAVADGGEVWMLDSANYNTATVAIAKSVTILAVPGVVGSVVASGGGHAITIGTAGVEVALRNLAIGPLPGVGGGIGISMSAGATLTVENCLVANLPESGIHVTAPVLVRISNTTVRDNGEDGILIANGARATITHSQVAGNGGSGIIVFGSTASSLTTADIARTTVEGNTLTGVYAWSLNASAVVRASVRDSRVVRNNRGIASQSAAGATVDLSASNTLVSNNATDGIGAYASGAKIWATGNTVSANDVGLRNSGGVFQSACDNAVRNNVSADAIGPLNLGNGCSGTYNIAFVTSTTYPPTFGDMANYDTACTNRALAAGFAGSWVAWTSSSTSFASSRLGTTARGWVQVDGKPFADTLAELTINMQTYYPLSRDEFGAIVPPDTEVWTATNADGTIASWNCDDWVNINTYAAVGFTGAAAPSWSNGGMAVCNTSKRLICLQKDKTSPVGVVPVPGRLAFLSVGTLTPGPGVGLATADNTCQSEATAAMLPGTYRALLATTGASAASRFNTTGATWVRVDGVPIMNIASELYGGFGIPLAVTANGTYPSYEVRVWTGASSFSSVGSSASTCASWLSSASSGSYAALANRVAPFLSVDCGSGSYRLYCLQQ